MGPPPAPQRPMSLAGLEQLAPMGYIPKPPPVEKVYYCADPISAAADSTFDLWMMLPPEDTRTIEEFAANPVFVEWGYQFKRPNVPPPPPPSTPSPLAQKLEIRRERYARILEHGSTAHPSGSFLEARDRVRQAFEELKHNIASDVIESMVGKPVTLPPAEEYSSYDEGDD